MARKVATGLVLPLALCAAALGGPVSQLVQISVTRCQQNQSQSRYELVVSSALPTVQARLNEQKTEATGDADQAKPEAPRFLKVITDNWDNHGGIAVPDVDVSNPPQLVCLPEPVTHCVLIDNVQPRAPPASPQVLSRPPPIVG
jgi:hypothetical protein